MSESRKTSVLSRREFLQESLNHAGVIGAGAAAVALSLPPALGAKDSEANPFAYDVSRLQKTDPKLIHYQETGRIRCPRPEARRIAIDAEGRLYIAAGNYVSVLDASHTPVLELALSGPPRCLAVAGDGAVYVGLREHLEVFDGKGQRKAVWDSPGKKTWFTGLAATEKDLFAADAGNRIVLHYDRSGKLAGRIGEKNKERNIPGFIVPSPFFDLKVHKDGLLRVTNPGRHRVEAYTLEGDFEFAWGKPSAAIDGFCGCCNPINLAVMADGRFVTCEKGLPRVKVYGAEGQFESVVAGAESFPENAKVCGGGDDSDCTKGGLDAVVDAGGRVHILDLVANNVRVMERKAGPKA